MGPCGDSRGNTELRPYTVSPENAARGRRSSRRRQRVTHSRITRGRTYSYPPRTSYLSVKGAPGGHWRVDLRDKRGRRFTWRSGLTYNQARKAASAAKRAHYRDPVVAKRGARA